MVSWMLLVIFNAALFLMKFSLIMLVACSFISKIFTMAIPHTSSTKELLSQPSFAFWGSLYCCYWENGIDVLKNWNKNLVNQSHLLVQKIIFIPITKSTLSWISDTKVKIFKSMSIYVYYHWNHKQYTDILSISYLNSLSVRRIFW